MEQLGEDGNFMPFFFLALRLNMFFYLNFKFF